ncbi:MAG: antibiotic biosynthesis monooxygenase [Planctomyces sp.]|nr:antibiotic biosynthesis monooxygenase [Planctomyces sp.]
MWRGWTKPENAAAYGAMLQGEIIPGLIARKLPGFVGAEVLVRHPSEREAAETEFMTVFWFRDLESVKGFAGQGYARAVIYPKAEPLLSRYEETVRHYDHAASLRPT